MITRHTQGQKKSQKSNKIFWKQTSMHAYTLQITHPRRSAKPATSFWQHPRCQQSFYNLCCLHRTKLVVSSNPALECCALLRAASEAKKWIPTIHHFCGDVKRGLRSKLFRSVESSSQRVDTWVVRRPYSCIVAIARPFKNFQFVFKVCFAPVLELISRHSNRMLPLIGNPKKPLKAQLV